MNNEIWKDIDNYIGQYQVSNLGRIRSLDRYVYKGAGSKGGLKLIKGKIRKNQLNWRGYVKIELKKYGKGILFSVHRLVAQAFIPNPDNKPQVNHKDGNKLNNNVDNLEWVTQSENNLHAYSTGIRVNPTGEKAFNSKLTQEQVNSIRSKYKKRVYSCAKLAKEFGISDKNIYCIITNKTWKTN